MNLWGRTFARQWALSVHEARAYHEKATAIREEQLTGDIREWPEGPHLDYNDASQAALMISKGGSAELARILDHVYGECRHDLPLAAIEEFVDDALDYFDDEQFQARYGTPDRESLETFSPSDGEDVDGNVFDFFEVFVDALLLLEKWLPFVVVAHLTHCSSGHLDDCYWSASIRLISDSGGFVDFPVFQVDHAFDTIAYGGEGIADVMGLPEHYDEETGQMVEEARAASDYN